MVTSESKMTRLCELLRLHLDEGQMLVFVDTQEACDNLFRELLKQGLACAVLHGGMGQVRCACLCGPRCPMARR